MKRYRTRTISETEKSPAFMVQVDTRNRFTALPNPRWASYNIG